MKDIKNLEIWDNGFNFPEKEIRKEANLFTNKFASFLILYGLYLKRNIVVGRRALITEI